MNGADCEIFCTSSVTSVNITCLQTKITCDIGGCINRRIFPNHVPGYVDSLERYLSKLLLLFQVEDKKCCRHLLLTSSLPTCNLRSYNNVIDSSLLLIIMMVLNLQMIHLWVMMNRTQPLTQKVSCHQGNNTLPLQLSNV